MSSSSSSSSDAERLTSLEGKSFGTFGDSSFKNDGVRFSGFKYNNDDFYLVCNPAVADTKLLRTKFGSLDSIAKGLNTNLKQGICKEPNLDARIAAFGENRTPEPPHESWLALFWEALQDVALIILMVAAVIALTGGLLEQFLLKEEEQGWIEGVSILVTVFLVAGVTATNDWSKDKQFRELKKSTADRKVRVIRDGEERLISLFDLVVGDVIKVVRGDKIPADGLFIPGLEEITVDQSSLTGEPDPIIKNNDRPFLYCGCLATKGSCNMLVLAVGVNTEWGRTMAMMPDEDNPTPLQEKLEDLVVLIGKIGTAVASVVFLVLVIYYMIANINPEGLAYCNDTANARTCGPDDQYNFSYPNTSCIPLCANGTPADEPGQIWIPRPFEPQSLMEILSAFIIAVTIIVVAVPEGLPLAVTISLAYSVKQMLDDQNLVRHLAACEVMGGATTICSDKTGTLTEGKMAVSECWLAGTAYRTSANLVSGLSDKDDLRQLLIDSMVLNNDDGELIKNAGATTKFLGNPTECAMLVLSERMGAEYKRIQAKYPPVKKWGFTSARKRMSTIVSYGKFQRLYCKGAAEILVERCNSYVSAENRVLELGDSLRRNLNQQIETYARQGLRTLTLCYRDVENTKWGDNQDGAGFEEDLTLIALVAIEDPLRPEVPDSVLSCKRAGIVVRMVTGDNILTAKKIATDCHILTTDGDVCMEGPDFAALSDSEALRIIPSLRVLARSRPQDKLRLVELLLSAGEVVAVTGDGTNDAPALSRASVGLAMGLAGTEVAKNAADIIILDDNFASIVKSVLWGRCIYDNIRKFLQFQLTVNVVALVVAFIGAVTNFGTPLTAVQLLWVNLIMDTMAALALGTEKPTPNLLYRRPYGKEGKLITPIMIRNILGQSIYQLAVLFTILYAVKDGHHLIFPGVESGQEAAESGKASVHYTLLFNSFVLCQVFNELNARKVNKELNIFGGLFTNWIFIAVLLFTGGAQALIVEVGGAATKTLPLTGMQWLYCIAIGAVSLPVGFILRLIPVPMEFWEVEDWDYERL